MEVKIKLKIKDVEIELKKDEAEELRDILNGLVRKEKEFVPYPLLYPVYPNLWDKWEITWGDKTGDPLPQHGITICSAG